jgi:hypothetical protein
MPGRDYPPCRLPEQLRLSILSVESARSTKKRPIAVRRLAGMCLTWSLKLPFVFTWRLTYSRIMFVFQRLAIAQKNPCALR